MGWLWASPSPQKPSSPAQDKPASTSSAQSAPPNEPVDPEIQKFLNLFAADVGAGSKQDDSSQSSSKNATASTAQSSSSSDTSSSSASSWFALKSSSRTTAEEANAPRRDALSESLLPTEMPCRQAFDLAWGCNSLGGQWNAVYRHGEMRSCSEHWDDFWYCMRIKSYTGEMKAAAVRQHYRNKEHAKYYAPGRHSSEDIWEAREHRLPAGSAFSQTIDAAPDVSDEEWREQESERRRKIREGLGFTPAPST